MLPESKARMYRSDTTSLPLMHLISVIRRRIWTIVAVAVVLTGVVVGFSLVQTPRYETSIRIVVGQASGSDVPVDVFSLQQLTQTVSEAANTRPIANDVINKLDLSMSPDTLLDNLNVEQIKATQFVEITYTDTDPQRAQRVADAVGEALSDRMSELDTGGATLTARVWEQAKLPEQPVSPKPVRNGFVALAAGVLLGAMLVFLLEYLDDSWRSPEELERMSGRPNLGMLPEVRNLEAESRKARQQQNILDRNGDVLPESLVTLQDSASSSAEAYRTLRTNLFYTFIENPPKAIVVSSAGTREGKSFVCANLGAVLTQAEKSTLIMDCDLRQPGVHKIFGVGNSFGVADVVAGLRIWKDVLLEPLPGLKIMTAGTLPPDPAGLLGSQPFVELLAQVCQEFDYVLLDTAPLSAGSDAAIIAHGVDGILFVVDAQHTRKGALRRSISSLETVGANVLGTIMNKVESHENAYPYGYGHSM
jgi:polysaccharide biosynthesis transport protein